jgi:hypothetical protein
VAFIRDEGDRAASGSEQIAREASAMQKIDTSRGRRPAGDGPIRGTDSGPFSTPSELLPPLG